MSKYIKVKLLNRSSQADEESIYKAQSPNNEAIWNNCKFTFNPLEKDYDWLVIVDDIPKIIPNRTESLSCSKNNTILVTTEPSSITRYGRGFAKQFKYLITNQEESILPHPNVLRSQSGNYWMYGKDFNDIVSLKEPVKTKKISTICSSKQQGHTLHKLRFDFTKKMEEQIPELERFGHGIKWIDTKAEALDDYEFHVAVENHIAQDVWTEKLADAFLGYCVPIYYGCPNVYDYFPKESLITIDIHNEEESIKKIKELISIPGEYERRLEAVKEARRKVIEEYNLLAMISNIVENSKDSNSDKGAKIYSRRIMRLRYLPDLFRFFAFKINNFFKSL